MVASGHLRAGTTAGLRDNGKRRERRSRGRGGCIYVTLGGFICLWPSVCCGQSSQWLAICPPFAHLSLSPFLLPQQLFWSSQMLRVFSA